MDRSRLYRIEAIVMHRSDVGEADRLLTVLSRERGKLRLNAKGARKVGSRKSGHVELFVRSRMLIAKGRGEIDIVSQVETIDAYRGLREDLTRSTYAHYAVELIDAFAEEGSEQPELFDLLAEGLKWIETTNNLPLTARYFELQLLTLAGFQPQVFFCAGQGRTVARNCARMNSTAGVRPPAACCVPHAHAPGSIRCLAAIAQRPQGAAPRAPHRLRRVYGAHFARGRSQRN